MPQVATLSGSPLYRRFGIPLHVARYQGGSYQTHYHSFLELIVVNADHGHNVIAGRRTAFRARQVYQLGMFHPHRIEAPHGAHCDYYNVTFQPEVVATARGAGQVDADPLLAPFYATTPAEPFLLPSDAYDRAAAICASLAAEIAAPDRFTPAVALGQFQALLGIIARSRRSGSAPGDPRVQAALRIISERFDEPLQTRDLAGAVGASSSRLAQLFRRHTGSTVREVVLRRRLTEAKRLLATTDLPITTALQNAGFSDVSYFNRTFRRDTGLTPRAYRRQAFGG